jgi:hypothetical protein
MDNRYQSWSRSTFDPPDLHRDQDAAKRMTREGVVDILHEPKFTLPRSTAIFAIGSCFARNIELALMRKDFRVTSAELELPREAYGGATPSTVMTKFNTPSMLSEIRQVFEGISLPDDGLIELQEGQFWSPQLHRVPLLPREEALALKAAATENVRKIAHSNLVVITLGLTEYWFDKECGVPLNNAPIDWRHARRTNRFEFRNTSFAESLAHVRELADTIFRVGSPDTRIVVTVSPVPLLRTFTNLDIIVANAYSKSTLRCVAHQLAAEHDRIDYFPSYEIVTNTPRHIAWRNDQRHVEFAVVDSIMTKFESLYFPAA